VSAGSEALPVAADWFAATSLADGVVLLSEPWVDPFLRSNAWLLRGRDRDLLVDSGNGIGELLPVVRRFQREPGTPLVVVATHTHSDHMGGMHEFGERLVHRSEAGDMARPTDAACLVPAAFSEELRREIAAEGVTLPDLLVTALPRADFDPAAYALVGCAATRLLDEGDTIDLGDRSLRVLHLPGHSPGSIGLWEEQRGILFSGDAVYESGWLLDELPGADIGDYIATVRRLRDLPLKIVHGGHDASFGPARLMEIVDEYLARRAPS